MRFKENREDMNELFQKNKKKEITKDMLQNLPWLLSTQLKLEIYILFIGLLTQYKAPQAREGKMAVNNQGCGFLCWHFRKERQKTVKVFVSH